jgi:hypothetical protein
MGALLKIKKSNFKKAGKNFMEKQFLSSEQIAVEPIGRNSLPASVVSAITPATSMLTPQSCRTCATPPSANGDFTPSFVYAIGKIEPRFSQLSVEKEFAQVTGRSETTGLTDLQTVQKVLSQRQNRYLARQMCWVMTIQGLETYILVPRDPADLDLLVEALRPVPSPMDLDIVIGARGPLAPPEMCNGLTLPLLVFDQIYSFDRDAFVKSIPRPEKMPAKEFTATATELFHRIMQIADNAGATDKHRALNYLAVRYPTIYTNTLEAFARNASLSAVDVQPSPLNGMRKLMDVIFSCRNRDTDVTEKFFVRVDVTEEFPFLARKLSPYYDR